MTKFDRDQKCPICSDPDEWDDDTQEFTCARCGTFKMPSSHEYAGPRPEDPRWFELVVAIDAAHKRGQALRIDKALWESLRPTTVPERQNRALLRLGARLPDSGATGDLRSDKDWRWLGAYGPQDQAGIISLLAQRGILSGKATMDGSWYGVRLTARGWEGFESLRRGNDSRQAFVAMAFRDDLTEAYETGIAPAIVDAGFRPLRIDRKDHNGRIDDEIMVEIRRSAFVVADFTGHRAGVYFEAGFALGLGKPVIWTVKKEDLAQLHFDTRQYNHIDWTSAEDLRKRLADRIRNTVAPDGAKV